MSTRRSLKGVLVAAIVAGGLAAGAAGAAYADGGASTPQPTSTADQVSPYQPPQVNARGQTYGSALGAMSYAQVPDLVSVLDNQGQLGYARKTDIFPADFPTGLNGSTARQPADLRTSSVPVFASDGVTVIGTYGAWG